MESAVNQEEEEEEEGGGGRISRLFIVENGACHRLVQDSLGASEFRIWYGGLPKEHDRAIDDEGNAYAIARVHADADKRVRINAIQRLEELLNPVLIVVLNPGFTYDDLVARHVASKDRWFLASDPEYIQAVLSIRGRVVPRESLACMMLLHPHGQQQQPRPGPAAELNPDDAAAIADAIAANEREAADQAIMRDGDDWQRVMQGGGGGGGHEEAIEEEEEERPAAVAVAEIINDRGYPEGGYQSRLADVILPVALAGAVVDFYGVRAEFLQRQARDNALRRNAGPRSGAAARANQASPAASVASGVHSVGLRRGQAGSLARQRMAQNQTLSAVRNALKKPESRKMVEKREEDKDIDAMPVTADDNTCMICMTSHITTLAIPCMHLLFCNGCITKWIEKAPKCPSCNTPVSSTVQVRGKFNPQDEHQRRKRDAGHVTAIANALQEEAAILLRRASEISQADDKRASPPPPPREPVSIQPVSIQPVPESVFDVDEDGLVNMDEDDCDIEEDEEEEEKEEEDNEEEDEEEEEEEEKVVVVSKYRRIARPPAPPPPPSQMRRRNTPKTSKTKRATRTTDGGNAKRKR